MLTSHSTSVIGYMPTRIDPICHLPISDHDTADTARRVAIVLTELAAFIAANASTPKAESK